MELRHSLPKHISLLLEFFLVRIFPYFSDTFHAVYGCIELKLLMFVCKILEAKLRANSSNNIEFYNHLLKYLPSLFRNHPNCPSEQGRYFLARKSSKLSFWTRPLLCGTWKSWDLIVKITLLANLFIETISC